MPAVPYVDRADLPEAYRYLYEDNENGELNVYRALGNNPPVLQSLMRWGTTVVASSSTPSSLSAARTSSTASVGRGKETTAVTSRLLVSSVRT